MQEETANTVCLTAMPWTQLRFTVFGMMSKDDGILKEDTTGCILQYCRFMDLPAAQ